jgi:hypothetical protein
MPAHSDSPSARKVRAHRAKLRAAGLRPVQIWVRDTRKPGFKQDAHRQSLAVAAADRKDDGLFEFMDAAWADLDEH